MPICTSGTSLVRNLVRDTTLSDALDIHLVYIFIFFPTTIRLGETEQAAGHTTHLEKIASACLRRFPFSDHVWKRFVWSLFE